MDKYVVYTVCVVLLVGFSACADALPAAVGFSACARALPAVVVVVAVVDKLEGPGLLIVPELVL